MTSMTSKEFSLYFTAHYPRVTLNKMREIQGSKDPLSGKINTVMDELKFVDDTFAKVCIKLNLSFLIQAKYN